MKQKWHFNFNPKNIFHYYLQLCLILILNFQFSGEKSFELKNKLSFL